MTQEQQRLAIARELGLIPVFDEVHGWVDQGGCGIPDYLNDRNACHEMKDALDVGERVTYADELCKIWTGRTDRAVPTWWWIHKASPSQLCEAFLKTRNLYK